ncbi:hypothetical protein TSUD_301460 [Trifolium subterraneum]|uniref:Uncharacterized protein n=1 Tax=Trifolium subterraneum TaxID=3900 RepID=A0A2Z6P1Y8_TRISU|nr:hypothetical protein TSUD_301460 [Trifolium subterraneum]
MTLGGVLKGWIIISASFNFAGMVSITSLTNFASFENKFSQCAPLRRSIRKRVSLSTVSTKFK